jgi:hypothetical protein
MISGFFKTCYSSTGIEWKEYTTEGGWGAGRGSGGGVGSTLVVTATRDLAENLRTPTFFLAVMPWE